MNVAAFKCGPDYIDAMFHEKVIEARSRNLDTFLTGTDIMKYIFAREAENADISVIEGVMGFYDGFGLTAIEASSHDISMKLSTPVIFVAKCGLLGGSLGAVVKGYAEFRKNNIKGIILNSADERSYPEVKRFIEAETGIKVLGYLPNVKELVIGSRHLGLVMPHEVEKLKEKLNKLADLMEKTIDIDEIVRIAQSVDEIKYEIPTINKEKVNVRIGVASDECFCFIYKDNMELLEKMGAEVVYFSPLSDKELPENIGGLIIPGGYPELYADRLSKNAPMLSSIKENIKNGMPCMAEGGGFMYLHNELEDTSETFHKMVGVIDGKAFRTKGLVRFGYITVIPKNDCLIGKAELKGHGFHFWDSTDCGEDCKAVRPSGGGYDCMHAKDNLFAGFPQLHYYSNPEAIHTFMKKCRTYSERQ